MNLAIIKLTTLSCMLLLATFSANCKSADALVSVYGLASQVNLYARNGMALIRNSSAATTFTSSPTSKSIGVASATYKRFSRHMAMRLEKAAPAETPHRWCLNTKMTIETLIKRYQPKAKEVICDTGDQRRGLLSISYAF